jgi:hypothetical protein
MPLTINQRQNANRRCQSRIKIRFPVRATLQCSLDPHGGTLHSNGSRYWRDRDQNVVHPPTCSLAPTSS